MITDVAYMAYAQYMEMGRMPGEIDGMDICAYIDVLKWKAWDKSEREKPAKKFIDDFIK